MISGFIENIVRWLIRNKAINPGDQKLYEYAVYSFLITISPLFIVILMGGIIGKVWDSILIIIPFMMLRKFSGGFHAKNPRICFTASSVLLFLFFLFW